MGNFLQNGLIQFLRFNSNTTAVLAMLGFVLLTMVIGYLCGSINSAIVISRLFYGQDIRKSGSGNAGTTNMLRTYGKKAALFTLLGDILKTVVAIFIAAIIGGFKYRYAYSMSSLCYIAGLCCILGHIFPIFYKFKGGKGVLCTAAAVAMLSIKPFAVLIAVFILLVALTKYVSLGSCIVAMMYPFVLYSFIDIKGGKMDFIILLITIIEALIILWCHRTNIGRLRRGEESKISFKSKKKDAEPAADSTSGEEDA